MPGTVQHRCKSLRSRHPGTREHRRFNVGRTRRPPQAMSLQRRRDNTLAYVLIQRKTPRPGNLHNLGANCRPRLRHAIELRQPERRIQRRPRQILDRVIPVRMLVKPVQQRRRPDSPDHQRKIAPDAIHARHHHAAQSFRPKNPGRDRKPPHGTGEIVIQPLIPQLLLARMNALLQPRIPGRHQPIGQPARHEVSECRDLAEKPGHSLSTQRNCSNTARRNGLTTLFAVSSSAALRPSASNVTL
ncbi:hypothetical protein SAMN05428966_106228 [Massilia sp. PDC64]|nr:hypothetical protein SAMN05428966_106228 [Massilia sp. PDC64]